MLVLVTGQGVAKVLDGQHGCIAVDQISSIFKGGGIMSIVQTLLHMIVQLKLSPSLHGRPCLFWFQLVM